jgi:hypothetical protein
MGKKRTPEEKAKDAGENGFADGDDDIDDCVILRDTVGRYADQT